MDPDTTLESIRELCLAHETASENESIDVLRARLDMLTENVQSLDEFLSRGGFRPRAWAFSPFPPARDTTPMSAPGAPAHERTGGTPTPVRAPGAPRHICRVDGHTWQRTGSYHTCVYCPTERHWTEDGYSYLVAKD